MAVISVFKMQIQQRRADNKTRPALAMLPKVRPLLTLIQFALLLQASPVVSSCRQRVDGCFDPAEVLVVKEGRT